MAADYHAHMYEPPGATHAILRGIPGELLGQLQIRATRSPIRRGYLIRSEDVSDAVAKLEYANAFVRVHKTDPKR